MSHKEQHFAGLHYANGGQIGASTINHSHRENSPNSPSDNMLKKIRARVYGGVCDDDELDDDDDMFLDIFDLFDPK